MGMEEELSRSGEWGRGWENFLMVGQGVIQYPPVNLRPVGIAS
jgi:hypothetical protein